MKLINHSKNLKKRWRLVKIDGNGFGRYTLESLEDIG